MLQTSQSCRPGMVTKGMTRPFSRIPARPMARSGLQVRSVLDLHKAGVANGKSSDPQVESLRSDLLHEMRYRIAPQSINDAKLYESTAWSVHNRLVDGLDATNDHWR